MTRLNPLSLIAIDAAPVANVPGSTNEYVNGDEVLKQDSNNYSIRMDYVLNQAVTLFGRYSGDRENDVTPGSTARYSAIGYAQPQNAVFGATAVVSPNVVNEARIGFNRMNYGSGIPEPFFDVNGNEEHLPYFKLTNYAQFGGAGGGASQTRDNAFQAYNNVSWQRGRNLFKFGAEFMFIQYVPITDPNEYGTYQFSSSQTAQKSATDGTGDALASFLLGYSSTASQSYGEERMDGHQPIFSTYAQDRIKVLPNLTLDLGLRYEIARPLYDTRGQTMGLDFSKVPTPQAIFALGLPTNYYEPKFYICGQAGYPKSCAYTDKSNFAPRFGLAWQVDPKTVFRMGGGIFYSLTDFSSISRLTNSIPANISQTLSSVTFAPTYQGFNLFPPSLAIGPSTQRESVLPRPQSAHQLRDPDVGFDSAADWAQWRDRSRLHRHAGHQATAERAALEYSAGTHRCIHPAALSRRSLRARYRISFVYHGHWRQRRRQHDRHFT